MKRFIYYLIWTVVIGTVLYAGLQFQTQLQENAETTYQQIPVVQFMVLFPMLIGALLRLPRLILQIRLHVPWTIDWIKLAVIALPAGYVAMLPILYFTTETPLPLASEIMTAESPIVSITAGIVFGYVLLDSLKTETEAV